MLLQLTGAPAGQTAGCAGVLLLSHLGHDAGCQYPGFPPALTKVMILRQVRSICCVLLRLKIIVANVRWELRERSRGSVGDAAAMRGRLA